MALLSDYQSLMNPDRLFVAFDIETTGLSSSYDRIVELGGVKFRDGQVLEVFNELIDPERDMPAEATKVNGITPQMLAGKPTAAEVLPRFLAWAAGTTLVAHNADFDTGFLNWTLKRQGRPLLAFDWVDTLRMAKEAVPGRKSYALQELAKDFGIKALDAHRASDDSRVCMEVFQVLLDKLNPGGQAFFF